MITPDEFLSLLATTPQAVFKLGTIPGTYASGRPTVTFDGETTASTRTYAYLSSYTPAASHRVLLAQVGNTWVVLGRVL